VIPAHLELVVEKAAAGGRMLARYDGQVVLLTAAIPGERVRARVERVSKGVIFASTIEVLEPSADRRPVAEDWLCGGNVYAHVAYPRQLAIKAAIVADAFTRIAHLPVPPPPVTGSPERGYRMRARLHVHGARLGFYREGTHDVCDARGTGQLLPATLDVLDRLAAALRVERVQDVTSIELSENVAGSQRALHLELERPVNLSRVAELAGTGVTGLSYTGPFSAVPAIVTGTPTVTDQVPIPAVDGQGTLTLQRNVRAFFQGNRYLLAGLVARVLSLVEPGPVVDLYAGVGLFAVALAATGRTAVTAVEGDRIGAQDLKANAAPYASRLTVVHQMVESFVATPAGAPGTSLIVDPPRTGLSREALDGIARFGAPAIVYVSCDAATLARDVRRLVDAGYRLEHLEAFDLFPNTAHVEAVVKLRKGLRA
jgi:23S rRNA (uracil1939-C5)-methyltransferase